MLRSPDTFTSFVKTDSRSNETDDKRSEWIIDNTYNLEAFGQINGEWKDKHPLPLPVWADKTYVAHNFDGNREFLDLVVHMEDMVRKQLSSISYNNVNAYMDFYTAFKKSNYSELKPFFHTYKPVLKREYQLCVNMAMEAIAGIAEFNSDVAKKMYLVSCQEVVKDDSAYVERCDKQGIENICKFVEKEHCLAALRISIGGRDGIALIDTGYHISRVVTVMKDKLPPHSGSFIQTQNGNYLKEYEYFLHAKSDNFVSWEARTTKNGIESRITSLIYIKSHFKTAIDVSARRNLAFDMRSLVSRTTTGSLLAGIYFQLKNTTEPQVSLLYQKTHGAFKLNLNFSCFNDSSHISDNILDHLKIVAAQTCMNFDSLKATLQYLAYISMDFEFIAQLLEINAEIIMCCSVSGFSLANS